MLPVFWVKGFAFAGLQGQFFARLFADEIGDFEGMLGKVDQKRIARQGFSQGLKLGILLLNQGFESSFVYQLAIN